MDLYDAEDEIKSGQYQGAMDFPFPIDMQEIIEPQACDKLGQTIWANQSKGEIRFSDTEDGVLRKNPPDGVGIPQILVPQILLPRLPNL